ncbi:Hypothetical Protein RRSL_02932 [Ralstonia solanacearum UW551]|uniref:Uncharacterized protein n=1 Tax=Ralstonia solanacearum (strain UW551) TaxID=342110 RepID=A0AB33VGF2_RALSU|nr:Hypothetical Protein RRSL_02932 [Ralstonia solanacearum UW551]
MCTAPPHWTALLDGDYCTGVLFCSEEYCCTREADAIDRRKGAGERWQHDEGEYCVPCRQWRQSPWTLDDGLRQ